MKTKMTYYFLIGIVGLVTFFGWKLTARAAYESAEYQVVESDGAFEIRQYADLTVVTTRRNSNARVVMAALCGCSVTLVVPTSRSRRSR